MNTKFQILTVALSACMAISLSSCEKKAEQTETKTEVLNIESDEQAAALDTLLQVLPRPSNVPLLLERSGAEYDAALINPASKVNSYFSDNAKAAVNLGVYLTDVSYMLTYDKALPAQEYIKAIKNLAEHIEVVDENTNKLLTDFEEKQKDKEALIAMVDKSTESIRTMLLKTQKNALQAQIMVGSFVEALYVSTKLVETTGKGLSPADRNLLMVDLMRTIFDQKTTLNQIIKFLNAIEPKESSASTLLNNLTPLKTEFDKFDVEEEIRKNDGKFVIESSSLKGISQSVEVIRANIVN
jgi:hypothetical protein